MQQLTVKTVLDWLNEIAPFETAESYDNVGLLVGSLNAPVERILVALDVTPGVLDEAKTLNVQLIVTHHPLMFRGTKRILEDDYEGGLICRMVRENISMIAAHTNLDQSPLYSGSAALVQALNLQNVRQEGFMFVGDLPDAPVAADVLRSRIAACENDQVYQYGKNDALISTLGISGGAYDEGFELARSMGAQAYLTGEVRHHNALAAAGTGFVLYQGGHFGTEGPLVPLLSEALQKAMNALEYDVDVYPSKCRPYGGQMAFKEETP
ncbi:MAG: Nif3-like dinuclear metal center hexameric protein [Clostridia bacterium]|nr:Nif3-like dinuclear metal center hexameric protein [Clostridia bacterium]